ncbi:MAG: VOC family protein [Actinobacteria bacterium]|nr:VOC family protein [Actinomycetota bacterium]
MLYGLTAHHICFAVDDLEQAAVEMAESLGAGPFFQMPHSPFDELSYADGEECIWDHDHAFGRLAGKTVELTRLVRVEPAGLANGFRHRPVNHLGYTAPDLEAASERLVAAGARRFLRARRGPLRMDYHELPGFGCIELLQEDDLHTRLAAALTAHATDWDGSRPFRIESPF